MTTQLPNDSFLVSICPVGHRWQTEKGLETLKPSEDTFWSRLSPNLLMSTSSEQTPVFPRYLVPFTILIALGRALLLPYSTSSSTCERQLRLVPR